jgi:hypothetical protein
MLLCKIIIWERAIKYETKQAEFPQQLLAEGTIINIFDHTGKIVLTSTIFPNKSIDIQRILNKGQFLGEDGTMYTSRFVKQ